MLLKKIPLKKARKIKLTKTVKIEPIILPNLLYKKFRRTFTMES